MEAGMARRKSFPATRLTSLQREFAMPEIFISDSGDDKNDGLRENTPRHSWERYLKLKIGNDRITILGDAEKTIRRLRKEIREKKKSKPRSERPEI
jgi:hypothetical protein